MKKLYNAIKNRQV